MMSWILHKKTPSFWGEIKKDKSNSEQIEAYFNFNRDRNVATISDYTCDDVDFNDLFSYVDRTITPVGQQFLYNQLRIIPDSFERNNAKEAIIKQITNDVQYRNNLARILGRIKDKEGHYVTSLFTSPLISLPHWLKNAKYLSVLSLFLLLLIPVFKSSLLLFMGVFLINTVIHFWNKPNVYQYSMPLHQLIKMNNVAFDLYNIDELKSLKPQISDSIIEINKLKNRISLFSLDHALQSDLAIPLWFIVEICKICFLLEPVLLFITLKKLKYNNELVEKVFSFVGEIDSLYAIASLRAGQKEWCHPTIEKVGKKLSALEIYHPLIDNCITNSFTLEKKSMLIVGSNMSGKSSFIRTMGLNIITGLTINTCFAKNLRFPISNLYSVIRVSDDLTKNKSYYLEEVLRIKNIIDNCSRENMKSNIILLDEIFKGTNTTERVAIAKAVLSYLEQFDNNIVFISTHDPVLADLLEQEYELYHFSETVDSTIHFNYKLLSGKEYIKNAVSILRIQGYPESIINEAGVLSGNA